MRQKNADKPKAPARHIVAVAGIFLACALFFAWAGLMYLPDTTTLTQREIVNDDYDAVTEPLQNGGEIRQTIQLEGRLYFVRPALTTYGRTDHGMLHLRVEDTDGATVTSGAVALSELLGNTFNNIVLDEPVDGGAGTEYTLVFTLQGATPEDAVGLFMSSGPAKDYIEENKAEAHYSLADFKLSQDGQALPGTLALQYVTRYAGGFIFSAYIFFAALITLLLCALYVLLFVLKWQLHRVFLPTVLGLGLVFAFLTPLRTAPDEYAHMGTTYHYTNVILGTAQYDSATTLTVREGDEVMLHNYDYSAVNIFAYQDVAENLFARNTSHDMVEIPARILSVFPLQYAAPTLGVLLGRLLGLGMTGLLVLGRLFNLIFFAVCGTLAIKRMPFAKPVLFVVGLLPLTLQQVASFNYDTYVLALSFLLVALCFEAAHKKDPIALKEWLPILVICVLLAPAKAVYVCMVALVLLIPAKRFATKRAAWLVRGGIFAAALVAWAAFSLAGLAESAGTPAATGESMEILANGDAAQLYTLSYILGHIPATFKLLTNTLWQQGSLWLQGLIGGRLGEIIAVEIEANWLWVIALLGILCLACLPGPDDKHVPKPWQRLLSGGIALAVAGLFVLACITWTPINYVTIFGIQGRYFLPVLPLLMLALRGRWLQLHRPIWRTLALLTPVFTVLIALDGFLAIAARAY